MDASGKNTASRCLVESGRSGERMLRVKVRGLPWFCRKFVAMTTPQAPRLAWIPGGSRGIGFSVASRLLSEGYNVALSGRDPLRLSEAVRALSEATAGPQEASAGHGATQRGAVRAIPCDVSDEASVTAAYAAILEAFGAAPDVLVNSAGISPWSSFTETTIEEFDRVIATNTRGLFLATRAVLPAMYERQHGTIIQILSIAATKAFRNGAAYVASKFAAHGFTNALREEVREHGVRVVSVLPGATETELWDPEMRRTHHGRMLQPEDVAEAIHDALSLPERALIEEIVLRPIGGDL